MKSSLKYILFTLLLVGIGAYVYQTWDIKALQNISFRWDYGLLACGCLVLHFLWVAFLSYQLIIANGQSFPFLKYLRVYFVSQLGRYLPGKVWMVVGKMEFLKKEGYSRRWIAGATVLEMLLMIMGAALVIGMALLYFQDTFFENYRWLVYGITACGVLGIASLKYILNLGSQILLKITRKLDYIAGYELPYKRRFLYAITLGYALSWGLQGTGFFYLIRAIYPQYHFPFYAIMSYAAAWIVGFLALFAPSGLGAKEGILILLLKHFSTASEAAVLAAVSRVWSTGIELLLALLFGLTILRSFFPKTQNDKEHDKRSSKL